MNTLLLGGGALLRWAAVARARGTATARSHRAGLRVSNARPRTPAPPPPDSYQDNGLESVKTDRGPSVKRILVRRTDSGP